MKVVEKEAKEIYTRTKLPGADWVVNPYVGCSFGCPYCYAKFMCRFRSHGGWGEWVEAKTNAPELARRKVDGLVLMSSICDPYQPVEAELRLTRRVLENMPKSTSLEILTKSPLVTRDIPLLKKFKDIRVGITVNRLPRELEPGAPSPLLRIQALNKLSDAGISTYCFISPIIPGAYDVVQLVRDTEDFSDSFILELLNFRASGENFNRMVEERYPGSLDVLKTRRKREAFVDELESFVGNRGQVIFHPR